MFEVAIHLRCTRKPGTLSRIIRELKWFGLQYQSHKINLVADQCQIIVNARGELNCTRENLRELFESFPEVLKVDNLSITNDGEEVREFKTIKVDTQIGAHEPVTPAILLTAEKRLSEIMGPVASFLVETAASQSRNVGELYRQLGDELNDDKERDSFVSIIKNNK